VQQNTDMANGEAINLGHVLKRYRAIEDLSVRDMAKEIGVHYVTLSRLERGDGKPSYETWIKITNWLGKEREVA